MSPKTKITATALHRLGYRRGRGETPMGNRWYFKRRLTRSRTSRCTVQVELKCKGYCDVNATEKRITEDGTASGPDFSSGLRTVRDLRGWESFAIFP